MLQSAKTNLLTIAVCSALFSSIAQAAPSNDLSIPNLIPQQSPSSQSTQVAKNELLVKFKSVQSSSVTNAIAPPQRAYQALQSIGGKVKRISGATGIAQITFNSELSATAAIQQLEQSGTIEYAEPNFRVKNTYASLVQSQHLTQNNVTAASNSSKAAGKTIPNDPRFKEQWGLNNTGQSGGTLDADIDAPEAWGVRTDATGAIVAVLGSGIDYNHSDLKANMWQNPNETSCTDGIDNDNNGYVDDCYGVDAYLDTGNPMDENGIGTHLAGIIGAVGNNASGVTGIGWKAKLMALRYEDEEGWGWASDALQALDYLIKIKDANLYSNVILLSDFSSSNYSKAMYDMLDVARTKGILVVTDSSYDLPNIINVSATNRQDNVNWGGGDLMAPGTDILSTWLSNTYKVQTGAWSSVAAAFVAGTSALVWSANPSKDWKWVKGAILNGVDNSNYYDYTVTGGRLNAYNSLSAAYNLAPAVFSVNPQVSADNRIITINGINFGTTQGKISFKSCNYPSTNILSWSDTQITAKVPSNCPAGEERLIVVSAGNKKSRGAYFRVYRPDDYTNGGYNQVVYPADFGKTHDYHDSAMYTQVGTDMWIISGTNQYGNESESVERFSLLTGKGEVRPEWEIPMPVTKAASAVIGSKIYMVGGFDTVTQKSLSMVQVFDTTTGTWTRARNLPKALTQPTVLSIAGKLWVIGGRDPNNTGLKTTYVYDPATNTWSTKKNLPLKRAYAGGVLLASNKIWLIGGETESGGDWTQVDNVLEYDLATDTWDIRDDLALSTREGYAVTNVNGTVFSLQSSGAWIDPKVGQWNGNISGSAQMLGNIGSTIYIFDGNRNVKRFESP